MTSHQTNTLQTLLERRQAFLAQAPAYSATDILQRVRQVAPALLKPRLGVARLAYLSDQVKVRFNLVGPTAGQGKSQLAQRVLDAQITGGAVLEGLKDLPRHIKVSPDVPEVAHEKLLMRLMQMMPVMLLVLVGTAFVLPVSLMVSVGLALLGSLAAAKGFLALDKLLLRRLATQHKQTKLAADILELRLTLMLAHVRIAEADLVLQQVAAVGKQLRMGAPKTVGTFKTFEDLPEESPEAVRAFQEEDTFRTDLPQHSFEGAPSAAPAFNTNGMPMLDGGVDVMGHSYGSNE